MQQTGLQTTAVCVVGRQGMGGPQLEVSSTTFELRWRQWDLGDDGWLWQGNKQRYIGGGHGKKA
jgi:hypothetical protein